jgi:hypothetical protein
MPIEQTELSLIFDATFTPSLIEQTDELKLVEEVRNATERERSGESIFERRPDLAAAAYYFLAKSKHGNAAVGHQALDTLRAAVHGAMSQGVNVESSAQRAFSIEYRIQGIIRENPMAFYGLMHYLRYTTGYPPGSEYERRPVDNYANHDVYEGMLGHYRFRNNTILGIFNLLAPEGYVFEPVRSHLSDQENSARLDEIVKLETSGVSLKAGLHALFDYQERDVYSVTRAIYQPLEADNRFITELRYKNGSPNGTLAARRPGSGIERFMALNESLRRVTEELARDYTRYRGSGSEVIQLETSLYKYLGFVTGRQLSPEETWDYLQERRSGLPVRDAVIEALGVHPEEFDHVMERAAQAGIFGEALRYPRSRDSRRPEARQGVK